MNTNKKYDVILIGAGLGALSVALNLPPQYSIAIFHKDTPDNCASDKAQGGIACAIEFDDSINKHIHDTQIAGAGLCNQFAVKHILNQAPQAIEWLIQQGVQFDKSTQANNPLSLHVTQEGGHSQRRIIHYKDITGHQIHSSLQKKLAAYPNIDIYSGYFAEKIILSSIEDKIKIQFIDKNQTETLFEANNLVLATGGIGQLYTDTTNPDSATGDGIALASKIGCAIENLECVQFHPTALHIDNCPNFLISEAVRGEGAYLRRLDNTRFMHQYDSRLELAPRDIVARAIFNEIHNNQQGYIYLDISHKAKDFILRHFPNIYQTCLDYGIDITRQAIPIAPAAHYSCGGVVTDLAGQTEIPHIYAVGEVASTGLHGANRLASNSLLECVVMGQAIANNIQHYQPFQYRNNLPLNKINIKYQANSPSHAINFSEIKQYLKNSLYQNCGIIRNNQQIKQSIKDFQCIKSTLANNPNKTDKLNLIQVNNQLDIAFILANSALNRQESRGLNYNIDYPKQNPNTQSNWVYWT